jgi:hypothetical protein
MATGINDVGAIAGSYTEPAGGDGRLCARSTWEIHLSHGAAVLQNIYITPDGTISTIELGPCQNVLAKAINDNGWSPEAAGAMRFCGENDFLRSLPHKKHNQRRQKLRRRKISTRKPVPAGPAHFFLLQRLCSASKRATAPRQQNRIPKRVKSARWIGRSASKLIRT